MADQCIIIEGSVKYRDGRKWKPRWCVMRKLSPVADCVHLLLYRDARARWAAGAGGGEGSAGAGAGAGVKAALSLARCVGVQECAGGKAAAGDAGGEGHALALLCRDAVHVLALDTRERMHQWLSAAATALQTRSFAVKATAGVDAGAGARLHVARGSAALAGAGVGGAVPRLLLLWEVRALRRFGADGDRLVLEGGASCGHGAGVHVLLTSRAAEAAAALRHQAALQLTSSGGEAGSSLSTTQRPDSLRFGPSWLGSSRLGSSRLGSSRRGSDSSLEAGGEAAGGAGGVTLARCRSCMSKLGITSAPPTAAFSPAWSMPPLPRSCSAYPRDHYATDNYDVPKLPSVEAEGEYYDTPKRLKCIGGEDSGRASPELCRIERRACGCVVRRRVAAAGDCGAGVGGAGACACRRVTDWAQGWLRRAPPAPVEPAPAPLYATVDLSRKSRRAPRTPHYENLRFPPACDPSLYENAGDFRRERLRDATDADDCTCGDDYLPMEPRAPLAAPAGYTAMSPPRPAAARASSAEARGVRVGAGEVRRCASVPGPGCRHSSSSNDSGVSLCSPAPRPPRPTARRSRSSEARGGGGGARGGAEGKSASAEAAVPAGAGGSSSSGASDMSDYIETLSLCSSHSQSSGEPPPALPRAATTLRPRAGAEYRPRPHPAPPPAHALTRY